MLHLTLGVRPTRIDAFAGALLVLAFLLALFLSLAPQVHQRIHSDANDASHECAVTLIAAGNYDHAIAAPFVEPPIEVVSFSKLPSLDSTWVASLFLGASIFEHAPPPQS